MTRPTDLRFEIYIAAEPAVIWEALTGPQGVASLYFGCRLETTFEPGAPYRYVGPDGRGNEVVHVEGTVLACRQGEFLQLTHGAGRIWQKGPKAYLSRLSYTLENVGFGTKLAILHDQWEEGDPGHAHNASGWMIFLSSVKSYVETGRPLAAP